MLLQAQTGFLVASDVLQFTLAVQGPAEEQVTLTLQGPAAEEKAVPQPKLESQQV